MIRKSLFLLSLFLGACSTLPNPKDVEIPLIDDPGSKKPLSSQIQPGKYEASILSLGGDRNLAQKQSKLTFGLLPNEVLEEYLNGIRKRLADASGVSDIPGKVKLEANTGLSAEALADGNIILSMAWIPDVESEDELAAIIAHELAHVLLKHQSTDIVGLTQKRLQSYHEMFTGARMSAMKATELGQTDKKIMVAAELSIEIMDKIAMPAWNRRQETEADYLGIDLMIKAGYSPEGMTKMLERLRANEKANEKSVQKAQAELKQLYAKDLNEGLQASWKQIEAELRKQHPETDKRLDGVSEYTDRHYGTQTFPSLRSQSITRIRSHKTAGPVIRNYKHAIEAQKLREAGNLKQAYQEALLAVSPPTAKDPIPNWELWQTARKLGKIKQHQQSMEIVMKSPTPIRAVYEQAIQDAESNGNYPLALEYSRKAAQAFGDSPDWMPRQIAWLKKMGRTNEVNQLVLQCAHEAPDYKKACVKAAKS